VQKGRYQTGRRKEGAFWFLTLPTLTTNNNDNGNDNNNNITTVYKAP